MYPLSFCKLTGNTSIQVENMSSLATGRCGGEYENSIALEEVYDYKQERLALSL